MKHLSFTQEFFLCAVNKKGKLSLVFSNDSAVCLVAGGIMELTKHGYIARDGKKKIMISKPWDNCLPYLTPMYEKIASYKRNPKVETILEAFALSMTNKNLNKLVDAFRSSLIDEGCMDEQNNQGLLKEKTNYVPKPQLVTQIIEKIRAEFLEEGPMSENVLCLAALLMEGNLIKNYFSKVEVTKMKARLKEIRNSDEYASVKDIFDYMDQVAAMIVIVSAAGANS